MKSSFQKIRNISIAIVFCIVSLFISLFCWLTSPLENNKNDIDVLSSPDYYIAHACGAIDGYTYLNCKEGLLQAIQNGYKYIELDLEVTSDNILVCTHDWEHFKKLVSLKIDSLPMSLQNFKKQKLLGKYTPLSLEDVISIHNEHPFIIVIDKISDPDILNRFFHNDKSCIMVEAFKFSDYTRLKKHGYTPMMTLWNFSYKKIRKIFFYQLKSKIKIDWICVHTASNMKSIRMLKRLFNCKVAMFSSNSETFFKEHLGKEIDLIYTDNWNIKTRSNNDTIHRKSY